jgi:endonuclease YncB( thermonuclease family)
VKKEYVYEARIARVVDGDTVYADIDLGFRQTARLVLRVKDLDTPEVYRPKSEAEAVAGREARDYAKLLLMAGFDDAWEPGIPTVLVTTHPDPGIYGRWLASITLPDGRDFATVMKERGYEKGLNV